MVKNFQFPHNFLTTPGLLNRTPLPIPPKPPNTKLFYLFPPKGDTTVKKAHRQQDQGWSIAMGMNPKYVFLDRVGNSWRFQRIADFREVRYYVVQWDGVGDPLPGLTNATLSQGLDYYKNGIYQYRIPGVIDSFTWAVWFFVNGTPSRDQWPPVPSRNPTWPFLPAWPEYPNVPTR